MELRKNCRKLTTALRRFWHREAGPMNWKNPVRVTAYIGWEIFNGVVFLVGEWVRYGVRAGQLFWKFPPPSSSFSGELGMPFAHTRIYSLPQEQTDEAGEVDES